MKFFQRNPSYRFFKESHQEICFYRGKVALILGIIFIPLFGGLDYFIARELFGKFILLRFLDTAFVLAVLVFVLSSKRLTLPLINPLVAIYFTSAGMMIGYMCELLGGINSSYYAGINLVILAMTVTMPWPGLYTIVAGGTMMGFYLWRVASLGVGPNDADQLINNVYFMASTIAISAVSSFLQYRMHFQKFLSEQEILNANEKLKELDKAKTRFFSNVTHEFRTPLVALSSTMQMILDEDLKDPALERKLLTSGKESLEDMLENVNDLLTKTRSEQGMLEMRWAEMDIVQFVEQALRGFEPVARTRGVKLVLTNHLSRHSERPKGVEESLSTQNRDPSTRPEASLRMTNEKNLRIYADRQKLKKIINNLVGNAMKFTKRGEIEVILETGRDPSAAPRDDKQGTSREDDKQSTSRDDRKDDVCILQVRDTGPGIPKEDLPTIFDPFTQASNNPLREVQGTGIGLSMVKDFVERHHGHVSVDSELGKGSVFTVTLPLGDAHVDKDKIDTSGLIEEGDELERVHVGIKSFNEIDFTPFATHDPQKQDILLVEDNPQVVQVLAYVLKDSYNLTFAKDGMEGVEKACEHKPDLVISDIMMPRMDGYELLHAIKTNPETKMIPVILLTSKSDVESRIKGLEEGADEYLAKPFNNKEVLTRVKSLIEKRQMEMEFVHAEKMIALGQLVAGVAHEINNPIFYAQNAAASIDDVFKAVERGEISLAEGMTRMRATIERIKDGTKRVCDITSALKGFVRQGAKGFESTDIHQGLDSTLLIVHTNRKSKVEFHKQYDLKDNVVCNLNQLNQVFLNLLNNAVQAFDGQADGKIWIRTYRKDGLACVAIRDNGPGIAQEVQQKIFNPFFTTKDVGHGTGLGLYISEQIVHEHGGQLSVSSRPGEGTEFTIQLPIVGPGDHHEREHTPSRFTHAGIDRGLEDVQYPHRG